MTIRIGELKPPIGGHAKDYVTLLIELKHWQAQAKEQLAAERKTLRQQLALQATEIRRQIVAKRKKAKRSLTAILEKESKLYHQTIYLKAITEGEEDCLTIATSIAEEFLGSVLPKDRRLLGQRVKEEIAQLLDQNALRVSVHPTTQKVVQKELAADYPNLQVLSDASVETGKAVIQTSRGNILIDWQHELSRFTRQLFQQFYRETSA